jgi:hypothetical protein
LRNHHHHNPQPSADGKQPLGLCVDEGHKSNPDLALVASSGLLRCRW